MRKCAKNVRTSVSLLLFSGFFFVLGRAPLHAQTVAGTILGNVTDASGSVIPNAPISITNQDTGVARNATSNSDGVYDVPSLLPGKYTVEARAQGFSPFAVKDVVVEVGSSARVDLKLQVGQNTQQVTVTEAVPIVDTTSSEVAEVMNEASIQAVPLNARDVQQLVAIQPGVQSHYDSGYGNRNMTIAGDRPVNNRFLQEGMDTTSVYHNSPSNLATNVMLGVEAVKEFKVEAIDVGPEYGEQSAGVVNVLFKSGTNQFHGSGYEFYRNNAFDARNYFDGPTTPPLHRNQFGGSLGGPILKDRAFFFINYEGLRLADAETFVANVPNAAARGTGNGTPGHVPCSGSSATSLGGCGSGASAVPAGTLVAVPVSAAVYNDFFGGANPLYPGCNGPSVGGGLCQFLSNPIQNASEDYGLVKIDFAITSKNTLSSSYNNDRGRNITPAALGVTNNDRINNRQTFTIQDTQIFTTSVVNTARFGVNRIWLNDEADIVGGTSRLDPNILPVHLVVPCAVVCTAAVPGFPSGVTTPVPVISISGGTATFGAAANAANFNPRWFGYTPAMFTDDVNYLHGKHAFQFGGEMKRVYDDLAQYRGTPVGAYTFQTLPQFMGGLPAQSFSVDLVNAPGKTYGRSWVTNLIAFYAEDTYKVKSNLTFNYGLRWEWVPGPTEKYDRLANIYNPTPLTSTAPAVGKYYSGSPRNFAPRVGFNWDPFKKAKTSVRGGAGIFFNEIWDDTFFTQGSAQAPFVTSVTLSNLMTLPFNQTILDNFVTTAKPNFAGSMQLNPKTPTKYGYNLSIQQELPDHIGLLISYVGATQRHQGRSVTWQEYQSTAVEQPGQLPMVNGVPIPGSVINPNCTAAGQLTCLYWAGIGVTNANVLGSVAGTNGATAATVPYATDCTATVKSNCFNNNNYGNSITDIIFDANSFYNAVQLTLERRMSPGLFTRFNYTYSSCITDAIGDRGGGASNGGGNAWTPTFNHAVSRARCSFQGNNSANFSISYDVPFGRMVTSRFAKAIAGDWQISSVTLVQSGFPFDVRLGANTTRAATSGQGNSHPDWAAPSAACPNPTPSGAINHGNVQNYINVACFAAPPLGYLGDMGPLVLTGPTNWSTDVSIKKNIPVRESKVVQLSADVFNAFNHTNLAPPDATTAFTNAGTNAAPSLVANTTSGQITRTVLLSRQIQIGVRFQF
jgi:hypothetical protein